MKHTILVSVSGQMGAGKSTVIDRLAQACSARGLTSAQIQPGDLLRRRARGLLDEASAAVWGKITVDELVQAVTERHGPFRDQSAAIAAADLAVKIVDETVGRPDPEQRTPLMRAMLQQLGSSWVVPGYWPKLVIAECIAGLEHVDAVFTSCRFPDEAQRVVDNGGAVYRLDVSRPTQRRRLARRDRFITSQEALDHPGEHALDQWPGFRRRFDTEAWSADTIAATILDEAIAFDWSSPASKNPA